MKSDLTDVIADLVFQAAPELTSRFEDQAVALRETKCTSPGFEGQWIDTYEVKYLFSILALGDEDFAARFPALAHASAADRWQLRTTLEAHLERCPHCSLKRGYDLELSQRIKKTCRQNSTWLLHLLEEDAAEYASEGQCEGPELEPVCSGNQ
jgi:hypothetical protein